METVILDLGFFDLIRPTIQTGISGDHVIDY